MKKQETILPKAGNSLEKYINYWPKWKYNAIKWMSFYRWLCLHVLQAAIPL